MAMTWDEANLAVTAPGQMFELIDGEVRGVKMKVFKNSPPHLGLVFANARNHGDKPFLVYEGETWTFAKTMDYVDALASLLVNTYGVKKGDRVAVAMRNYPEWVMSFAAIISSARWRAFHRCHDGRRGEPVAADVGCGLRLYGEIQRSHHRS